MKQFSKLLMLVAVGSGILTVALSLVPSKPVGAAGSAPAMVRNTPLPVQGTVRAAQSGTWNVGITVAGVGSTIAQTTQTPQMAYASLTCCPPTGGACNAFCDPYSLSYSFIVTPTGGTDGPNDAMPTWSADGTKIAFARNNDIFASAAAGGTAVNLTYTANNQDPAWSPDGARIAFTTTRDGHSELYLMNPDGSNVVRLTYNVAISVGHPAWSRDSARIAFNCQVESNNDDICAINSDGTGFLRLTNDSAPESGPTWSPDSMSIAFSTSSGIAVMNADGSNVMLLGVTGYDLAWSPDGAQIAFDAWNSDGYPDIFLMQANGTNVNELGKGAYGAAWPAWMPMRVPVATFKVSCNGVNCNLNASGSTDSYGTLTSYAWSFGDGATGTGAAVTHVYASGGAYTTKLTVTDSNGTTATKFQIIAINPVVAFAFSCNGLACSFDASGSKDTSATITSYSWNFGDGASGAGVTVSHAYAAGNSYNVTLTVADSTGAIGTQTKTLNVNTSPLASFTFTCNQLTCSFNGSGSRDYDGTIASYAWNFGDSSAASGPTVSHAYSAGGQYTVTLTVTDNAGATNTQSQTIVANSPPVAAFTFSCSRFTCSFDASGSKDSDGMIASYSWSFGDGATGSGEWIGHTYLAPGTYRVTLTVTDNGAGTSAQSQSVTVRRQK